MKYFRADLFVKHRIKFDLKRLAALFARSYRSNIITLKIIDGAICFEESTKETSQQAVFANLIRFAINPGDLLIYKIDLPPETGRDWLSAVRFGLARWTPFDVSEVYLAARKTATSRSTMSVEIRLAPRHKIDAQMFTIEQNLRKPDILSFGPEPFWDVDVDTQRRDQYRRSALTDACLLLSASTLLAIGLQIYHGRISHELARLKLVTATLVGELNREKDRSQEIAKAFSLIHSTSSANGERVSLHHQLAQMARHIQPPFQVRKLSYAAGTIRLSIEVDSELRPPASWAALPKSYKILSMRPSSSKNRIVDIEYGPPL
jgi:hypothetical protein